MPRESLDLDSSPTDEPTVQVGPHEYLAAMRAEIRAYRRGLIKLYGEPPASCSFEIRLCTHDFGPYLGLSIRFDPTDDEAQAYAQRCEYGFERWSDAGLAVTLPRDPAGNYLAPVIRELEEPPLAEHEPSPAYPEPRQPAD